ncbi:DUF2399 domain-containing protein [Rhizobacter sp. Root1221]|uniref:DUF2399 domain-containing protein n=1 Tax=Rhizobacter sp. Root1221 TaxID=1736433 RepID=UPI003514E235
MLPFFPQLAQAGARLRYHGDFDGPGVQAILPSCQTVGLISQRAGTQTPFAPALGHELSGCRRSWATASPRPGCAIPPRRPASWRPESMAPPNAPDRDPSRCRPR